MSSLTPDELEEPRDSIYDTSMTLESAQVQLMKKRLIQKTVPPPSVAARNLAAIKDHIRRIRTCNNMNMPEYLFPRPNVPHVLFAPPIQNLASNEIFRPRSLSADAIHDKQIFSQTVMKKLKKPQFGDFMKTPRKRLVFGDNDCED